MATRRFGSAGRRTGGGRFTKVRGRGARAPENEIGADGIFQLEVLNRRGAVRRRKGLLFQAKKDSNGSDQRLFHQAAHSRSAIVIDYRKDSCTAVSIAEVIEAGGNRRYVRAAADLRLAQVLGDEFVRCRRGEIGPFWDHDSERLFLDGILVSPPDGQEIMQTVVQQIR